MSFVSKLIPFRLSIVLSLTWSFTEEEHENWSEVFCLLEKKRNEKRVGKRGERGEKERKKAKKGGNKAENWREVVAGTSDSRSPLIASYWYV